MMSLLLNISLLRIVVDPILWYILAGIVGLYLVYLIRIKIAYKMAKSRQRDPLGWVLLSIFVSPILTWIILIIVGKSEEKAY